MKALIFDLDGVLYQGSRIVAGAAETIRWCEEQGTPHLFATNTSSRPRSALVDRLSGMGLTVSPEQIFARPVAARDHLARRGCAYESELGRI
jgi:ribonucleotide monophosphatase NagD (HAD superfamily)